MPVDMGMPGRGMMFVGENGVHVNAFYGGSSWISDHLAYRPGQQLRGLPGGQLLPESRFKDFKQPAPTLPRCERSEHYTDWIRACKAGKKSMLPIEQACDWTEFALLGSATLRRYSAPDRGIVPPPAASVIPGSPSAPASVGSGRSDSAVVWIPATTDGHVHDPNGRPLYNNGTGANYYRTSKVLRWDAKAGRFTNDELANSYVDTAYRKEWDYKRA